MRLIFIPDHCRKYKTDRVSVLDSQIVLTFSLQSTVSVHHAAAVCRRCADCAPYEPRIWLWRRFFRWLRLCATSSSSLCATSSSSSLCATSSSSLCASTSAESVLRWTPTTTTPSSTMRLLHSPTIHPTSHHSRSHPRSHPHQEQHRRRSTLQQQRTPRYHPQRMFL